MVDRTNDIFINISMNIKFFYCYEIRLLGPRVSQTSAMSCELRASDDVCSGVRAEWSLLS